MVPSDQFLNVLQQMGVQFFSGVPDSLLKHFCACVNDFVKPENHIIAANEGSAVAIAVGHHLATGGIPLVYMQNSGLGNSINPLLSLADTEVYGIPLLLLIGWRGEPGYPDEPQHVKQGHILLDMLKTMDIPFRVIGPDSNNYQTLAESMLRHASDENRPVALVVRKGTFSHWKPIDQEKGTRQIMREEALKKLVHAAGDKDIMVSTTGMLSRELFEVREAARMGHNKDFLTVGSMGHCSQIALGLSKSLRNRNVYCLDGDGSMIMHMGSLAIIGQHGPQNLKHVVFNNGAHDSVGGQPTVGFSINIPSIALACGYRRCRTVKVYEELKSGIAWLIQEDGPVMLEVQTAKGARADLGRPARTPMENKKDLMTNIRSSAV